MKVCTMLSSRGNKIANQFIITDRGIQYFQSYQSIICMWRGNKIYLDKYYYNYSKTTAKYRNLFLNETTKEIEAKIKSGEYQLTDLNSDDITILTTEGLK